MPSQYSTDLRIELIANGEKSGTWGTITNDNLGVIIEDAISGLVTFTTAVQKYPLTAQDGAVDQARCAALAIDTTHTGDFEIYVPPVTKLYVFKNTDNQYNATVYCSDSLGSITPASGGTSVVIPPGKTVLLRTDGTNVVEQLNHTVSSFSTGGALTVADSVAAGGNATAGGSVTSRGAVTAYDPIYSRSTAYLNVLTPQTVAQSSAINTTNETITLASAVFVNDTAVMLSSSDTMPTGLSTNTTYYVVNTSATSYFSGTGSISGTVLTISAVNAGSIGVGTAISGNGVTAGTTVSSLGTGTGGTGTYNLSASQTVASTTITGTYSGSQTIKLSTSSGGSAENITAVGTGNLTLTPVSLANTAPTGSTTKAIATTEFVANSVIDTRVLKRVNAATTSDITLSGTQTIDGVALVAGDRVLVKDQLTSPQTATFDTGTETITVAAAPNNGDKVMFTTTGALPTELAAGVIYYVVDRTSTTFKVANSLGGDVIALSGTPSGTNTVGTVPSATNGIYEVNASTWSRTDDANTAAEIAATQVSVLAGTVNGGRQFTTDFKSTETLGATTMEWSAVITATTATGTAGQVLTTDGSTSSWQTPANNSIGVGQTWQAVTRSLSTTYTNSTGKPIMVATSIRGSSGSYARAYVDGVNILASTTIDCCGVPQISYFPFTFVVPDGSTYYCTGVSLILWRELR